MKIVFMGTPDFAVRSLDALIKAGHDISAVFTQPDKPQGRKMKMMPPAVKTYALTHDLTVYQPQSIKSDDVFEILSEISPDLIAVVAYGKILPQRILNLPKFGCINGHASLLPKYRGASPIQWSIYCGDNITGVTTMLMDAGMDTGDMLMQEKCEITDTDNFETLHDKLAEIAASLLVDTVAALENGRSNPKKQPKNGVSYAPIISKEMGKVDFNKSSFEIDCQIRAFSPWPSAYFFLDGKRFKIISATKGEASDVKPGTIIKIDDCIHISCGSNSSIKISEIQPEGKGRMTVKALLNGHPVVVGTQCE